MQSFTGHSKKSSFPSCPLCFPPGRTDRYNHELDTETEDDGEDLLFHSFSSCSPRYSRVYSQPGTHGHGHRMAAGLEPLIQDVNTAFLSPFASVPPQVSEYRMLPHEAGVVTAVVLVAAAEAVVGKGVCSAPSAIPSSLCHTLSLSSSMVLVVNLLYDLPPLQYMFSPQRPWMESLIYSPVFSEDLTLLSQ